MILQALSSREEERIGKTRLALLALCQAGSAALADTRAEEAVRGGLIDAIDVEADLRAFVAETLSGDGATAAAATTATTAEAAPEHHPNHHHHHPHRRAESPPATALLAAAAAQQQLLQLGQTLQGAALAEKLDLLAKEGPRAVVALAAPPVSTSPAPAVDATTIVSPLASPPALAASVSVSVSASGAGLGGGGTRASTSSKRLEYYSCRYPEGTPAAVLAAASGAAITDSSSVGTTTTTTLTESSGVGGGTGTGGGADSPPPGPMRHRSVNLSMGSIDLGFNSDDEEKGGGGGEGDARSKKKKQRPAVRFVAASISRELSASVNRSVSSVRAFVLGGVVRASRSVRPIPRSLDPSPPPHTASPCTPRASPSPCPPAPTPWAAPPPSSSTLTTTAPTPSRSRSSSSSWRTRRGTRRARASAVAAPKATRPRSPRTGISRCATRRAWMWRRCWRRRGTAAAGVSWWVGCGCLIM